MTGRHGLASRSDSGSSGGRFGNFGYEKRLVFPFFSLEHGPHAEFYQQPKQWVWNERFVHGCSSRESTILRLRREVSSFCALGSLSLSTDAYRYTAMRSRRRLSVWKRSLRIQDSRRNENYESSMLIPTNLLTLLSLQNSCSYFFLSLILLLFDILRSLLTSLFLHLRY